METTGTTQLETFMVKGKAIRKKTTSQAKALRAEELLLGEFDALDREKTLFILPVSSLEVHGWHLPNGTDMIGASIMAEETGRLFANAHPDWKVVLLPLLNIGTDELPLPGSVEFSRKTVYRALCEYARSLSKWGFRNLVLTNGHGGLRHNLALDDACRTCNRKYRMRMVSPGIRAFEYFIFGKKFPEMEAELGRKLTPAEKEGLVDIEHAGGWETSIIQHARGDLVAPDYKKHRSTKVPPAGRALRAARFVDRIRRFIPVLGTLLGKIGITAEEGLRIILVAKKMYVYVGKRDYFTYSGDPSVARQEIGAAWSRALPKVILGLIEPVYITKAVRPSEVVSVYSTITFLRHDFMTVCAWLAVAATAVLAVWWAWQAGLVAF